MSHIQQFLIPEPLYLTHHRAFTVGELPLSGVAAQDVAMYGTELLGPWGGGPYKLEALRQIPIMPDLDVHRRWHSDQYSSDERRVKLNKSNRRLSTISYHDGHYHCSGIASGQGGRKCSVCQGGENINTVVLHAKK